MRGVTHHPLRSLLAVPATSPRFLEKAASSEADAIFIDLEDAVIDDRKIESRKLAVEALNALEWGNRLVLVRVNALATAWGCRDILDLVAASPRLDGILLPKCDAAADVYTASMIIGSAELETRRVQTVSLFALIETARGVANVEAIAQFGGRLQALVFGGGDYQLDLGRFQQVVGAPSSDYVVVDEGAEGVQHWNDVWHFAMARVANAARAYGLTAVDGPYSAIQDTEGLHWSGRRARALGFEAKMAIHPQQLAIINGLMSPSAQQIAWAENILSTMQAAAREGRGATRGPDGEMIDLMHVRLAKRIKAVSGKTSGGGAS